LMLGLMMDTFVFVMMGITMGLLGMVTRFG
jgi:hypothetical protein